MGFFSNLFKNKSQSEILKDVSENGSASEQLSLGYKYETGEIGGTPNYEISMMLYQKAAAKGDGMAMNNIGWAYHRGLGVEQDQTKAKIWFEKAIEKDNVYAMSNLGIAYFNGMFTPDIPQDYEKAAHLLEKAARHGDIKSQYNLGVMILQELGGIDRSEGNLQIAQHYIESAAKAGHPLAINLLNACKGDVTKLSITED